MNDGIPEEGQIATVRQRPFVVTRVMRSALPLPATLMDKQKPQHLVTLSSVEDEGLGEELQVVWELEPGAVCVEKSQLPILKDFDHPRYFDAFLDAVAWGAVSQADVKHLQSPFRSGIDVDDYQLDPVVRALSMPRVNLLVADDVGLGKTIEAGLVAQELILRHRVRSILIVCPSSIQVQWKEEMRDKFGLEFRIVDSELLRDLRRRRGIHVNPWTHFPRLITSIDYLKRERPLRLFRETLPAEDQPRYPRPYDLMILDEAHNVAPPGRGKYAMDSMRTASIRMMAPFFEHKLFLTATPHNGYPESFTALLELLDNQRFARTVPVNRSQLEAVMVRRMKSDFELRADGSRRFARRIVKHLEVPYTADERHAHRALQAYTKCRSATAKTAGEQFAVEFVLKLLKKRLFSSPAAFATTLEKHASAVQRARGDEGKTGWKRQVEEADNDFWNDEERDEAEDAALETASRHTSALATDEQRILKELREYAARACARADCKAKALIAWLKARIKPAGAWSDERVIIFTEYRATQKWLHDLLAAEELAGDGRLAMIYGGMKLEDREAVKAAFQAGPKAANVRILLATDAASEGLNLQNHCWQLIHYEIPWNPNRMEQRNGRVDRHGQKHAEVHVHHFVGAGFDAVRPAGKPGELDGDLEFLMRTVLKVETIREDLLGKVGPVIASQVEEAMMGRRRELDTARAEKDSEPMRRMLKFERNLREQWQKLAAQLQSTERELRLSPENIQNVVTVGLALAGQPPLKHATAPGIWPDASGKRKECPVFSVPVMSGSWAHCLDGLEHPHTKTVRPIVFDHALATGRDDVVLCHLNHRLVQMCLRLLRAKLWSQGATKKLNRFTARMVPDRAVEALTVIAHGRLLVLGGDNQRVHEEIITAGGVIRDGRFARMNVGDTETACAAAGEKGAPGFAEDALKTLWGKIEEPLFKSMEARMKERTENLQKLLEERAAGEVSKLTAIMKELEQSILKTLEDKGGLQMEFEWSEDEKSQRERDLVNLRARLAEIPAELEREVKHLRSRYRDPQPRMFPIAITFLVPPSALATLEKGGGR